MAEPICPTNPRANSPCSGHESRARSAITNPDNREERAAVEQLARLFPHGPPQHGIVQQAIYADSLAAYAPMVYTGANSSVA